MLSVSSGSQRKAGKILIVDDNKDLVSQLQAVLLAPTPDGVQITVDTAARGQDALAIARRDGFDVAIVDVKLPDVSGIDLILQLKEACPFSEVVLITGFASVDAAISALRSGAFAFTLKSFRPEELISTVEQALMKVQLKYERRSLEKRAADAEALSAMGALALNLAHEIRNPLNAAVLQLHLLDRGVDKLECEQDTKAALKKRTAIVGDEIGRLSRLLTEFLELARPRSLAREPVHVARLVTDVLDLYRDTADARGIDVVRDLAPEGTTLVGDAEKLKQVVVNLVVNAMEAMKQGGTLSVGVIPVGERVQLWVSDTGTGIPPEVIEHVFDPFFTTKEAGTGLGLSIVRKIVDQHGGEVRIQTEPGHGARVEISLPRLV
jgi:signal transduction histidine kinase